MNNIIAVTPSNVYDVNKMKYLIDSAKINSFTFDTIGVNKEFIFLSKILWFIEYLKGLPISMNPIISFTDAYDVFYADTLETIKEKFLSYSCDIVWSVEKWYSHQLTSDKYFYDNLENLENSPYKYINTGTFIGYKNSLLSLLNDIENSIKDTTFLKELNNEGWQTHSAYVDQTIISHHLAKHWQKYDIKLDYMCNIFYIPSGEWGEIDKYIDSNFLHTITNKRPSIVHVPWKSRYEKILTKLFYKKYKTTFLSRRKYSWNNDSITFLENGIMDAFGEGKYIQQDKYTFEASFGGNIHLLVFSSDYTEFTSTRHGDNEIVKGQLIS